MNILLHQGRIHTNQFNGKRFSHELLLDLNCVGHDLKNGLVREFVLKMLIDEASEVSVHTLVSADKFVGEGESWHKSSLLQPENGTETSREENSLNTGKGNYSFGKGIVGTDPTKSPLSLLCDRVDVLDGLQEIGLLSLILNVSIDQKGVSL